MRIATPAFPAFPGLHISCKTDGAGAGVHADLIRERIDGVTRV